MLCPTRSQNETSAVLLSSRYRCHVPETTCAVIGGGPAGIVLGLILARAGVDVTVLEKHGDFLRDSAVTQCIPRR